MDDYGNDWLCLCSLICALSPAELSTHIAAFMGLRSHANLPCLVNLVLKGLK